MCIQFSRLVALLLVAVCLYGRVLHAQVSGDVEETAVYKTVGNLQIQAEIFRPPGDRVVPVVVWIHGGALINGHRQGISSRVRSYARKRGFALVSIDYRLAPETKLPSILEDVEDALAWIRGPGARQYHLDPTRIAVTGGSAGGYLTLTTGYRVRPRPQALVAFWGYGDLIGPWYSRPSGHPRHNRVKVTEAEAWRQVSGPPVADSRDRAGNGGLFYNYCRQTGLWPKHVSGWDPHTDPEKFFPFMPVKNVTAEWPPTLMIHGTADTDVPHEQSEMMARQFTHHHVPHRLISIEDGEHGLAGGDPASIERAYQQAETFLDQALMERPPAPSFEIQRSIMTSGYDGKHCWVHARAGIIPANRSDQQAPTVVLTTQRLMMTGSDVFYALNSSVSKNLAKSWSPLVPQPGFQRRKIDDRTEETTCDFTPMWHDATGKLLGTGHTVRYLDNKVMKVRPRATSYSVYDEATGQWSPPRLLKMPAEDRFQNCGAGSVQRFDLENGEILLPVYYKEPTQTQYSVTVCRCRFDGKQLSYVEHGNEMTVNVKRGFVEPSITRSGQRYYLTLRNDEHGYVTSSEDGLHFDPPRQWRFDDGSDLGNYNTQQHWVTHEGGLFLVYTRKGADNDHVFRHRAPLFIAQVNPDELTVIRDTERILVPERGARLGNFGVVEVTPQETWVVVTEWMQTWGPNHVIPVNNKHGADNSIQIAKIKWSTPYK